MIGVFGGTFDPPHLGHLILADEARSALNLELVLWAPVGDPPHKPDSGISDGSTRARLVQAAIMEDSGFRLSRVDLDRPGPHFTTDGLQLLKQELPGQDLAYIMGADSLVDLPQWHEPTRLVEMCAALGVLRRPGTETDLELLERSVPGVAAKTIFLDAPMIGISGAGIRLRVKQGRPYRYLVLHPVADLMDSLGLYR